MKHINIFIELTRLNKPIGFMLLFWPCAWGLGYAFSLKQDFNLLIYYFLLFFAGSVLMRSAGCVFNDVVDKDFDKKVSRTRNRPIASGRASVKASLILVSILCAISFVVLIQFNKLTIALGLSSMILAFSYPFMKRFTYWPQLFLGLTYNWGVVMAYAAYLNSISFEIIILYFAAIFWTLGYDTIYGAQDMSDDEIIGVKSTAIKFKNNLKLFIATTYSINVLLICYLFKNKIGLNLQSFFLLLFILSLIFQVHKFDDKKKKTCLRSFKMNNFSGLFLFLSIFLTNFNNEI